MAPFQDAHHSICFLGSNDVLCFRQHVHVVPRTACPVNPLRILVFVTNQKFLICMLISAAEADAQSARQVKRTYAKDRNDAPAWAEIRAAIAANSADNPRGRAWPCCVW